MRGEQPRNSCIDFCLRGFARNVDRDHEAGRDFALANRSASRFGIITGSEELPARGRFGHCLIGAEVTELIISIQYGEEVRQPILTIQRRHVARLQAK